MEGAGAAGGAWRPVPRWPVWCLRHWVRLGPLPAGLLDAPAAPSTVVVDRHGTRIYEALSTDDGRSAPLDAAALPPTLVAATLAAEDRRYLAHPGVDPIAIARAIRVNVMEGRAVEGGSTISQQVAKLLLNRRQPDAAAAGSPSSTKRCWRCASSIASTRRRCSRCT